MADQPKRAGCHLSALRQCHCIGRAAGPNCRFWSDDLDGDIARANERTAAERIVPNDPDCTCGSTSPRAFHHAGTCPHSTPWNDRVNARLAAPGVALDGGKSND